MSAFTISIWVLFITLFMLQRIPTLIISEAPSHEITLASYETTDFNRFKQSTSNASTLVASLTDEGNAAPVRVETVLEDLDIVYEAVEVKAEPIIMDGGGVPANFLHQFESGKPVSIDEVLLSLGIQ